MTDHDDIDMLAAEYVLGTLDAEERAEVARRRQHDAGLDACILAWEARLAPLGDAIAARGWDVAALSLPGRGGSDDGPVASLADAATVVAAALAELAPDGTVLAGHSMGGGIAIETALSTPARLRGLVLLASGARLRVHPDILVAAAEGADRGEHLAELSALSLRPDGPAPARDHGLAAEAITPGPVAVADWEATDRFDRLDDLGELDLPVLAVAGDADALTPPRYAAHVAEHAPSAEHVVLPGAGHWLPVEDADRVADLVGAFLHRL